MRRGLDTYLDGPPGGLPGLPGGEPYLPALDLTVRRQEAQFETVARIAAHDLGVFIADVGAYRWGLPRRSYDVDAARERLRLGRAKALGLILPDTKGPNE